MFFTNLRKQECWEVGGRGVVWGAMLVSTPYHGVDAMHAFPPGILLYPMLLAPLLYMYEPVRRMRGVSTKLGQCMIMYILVGCPC